MPDNPRIPPKNLGASTSYDIMKVMKHNHIIYGVSIIGLAALILMLTLTSPTEIGPFGVLLFFTTVYVTLFGVFTLLFQIFRSIALQKPTLRNKDYLYTAVFTFAPIMLLMASSFNVVNIWTVGLICIFTTLAEFLVYKRI